MFVHAPDGKFKVTPEHVPRKPDLDKFFKTGSWELETCMSQDAWIGEWLPSSGGGIHTSLKRGWK